MAPATGPVTLVTDLNVTPLARQLSLSDQFTRMGGSVYFSATGTGVGQELWRTDGTPQGTTLVRDIIPGPWGTDPSQLTVWKERLYFVVSLPWGGITLYVSDGTAAGTLPHAVIAPEGQGGAKYVDSAFPTRNGLCLSLVSGGFGAADELLCAKETPQELVRIPGPWEQTTGSSGLGYHFSVVDGVAYFDAGANGAREGWRTDGTPEGTSRFFVELLPGLSSGARSLASFQGTQYFRGGDAAEDRASLWRTDGTPGGTVRVKQLAGQANCACGLFPVGDTLWLPHYTPETGVELWKSDGTAEGTVFVKDLVPGPTNSSPFGFVRLGATTLFWAGSPEGFGVWRTDGTAAGTVFVKATPTPRGGQVVGGAYYFQHLTPGLEQELWRTDGTAEGTRVVKRLGLGANVEAGVSLANAAEVNGTLVFRGRDVEDRFGPWRSDGTEAGTLPLVDAQGTNSTTPRNLAVIGSRLYFLGRAPGAQYGVWTTDGTAAGTVALHPTVSPFVPLPVFGGAEGRVFFRPLSTEVGQELWVSDGTAGGTRLVKDIVPGAGSSWPEPLIFTGGALYFRATEKGANAGELWRTDGTPENTWPVRTLLPGGVSAAWPPALAVGNTVYFLATTADAGQEPWLTDGTPEGTRMLGDLAPGTASSGAWPLAAVGDTLYLFDGSRLWKSDGTAEGTRLVKDVGRGTAMKPVVVGSTLYFLLGGSVTYGVPPTGYLWKTDGTPEGTLQVRTTRRVEQPTAMGGVLYFFEEEPLDTHVLWRTDGTEAGTWRVKELPRIWWLEGSSLSEMLAVEPEGRLIFAAADASGVEPWVSDGTPEGTRPLQDLYPGTPGSSPHGFSRLGGYVYFGATDGTLGLELWKVPVSALVAPGPDGTEADAGTAVDAGTPDDAGTTDDAGTMADAGATDAGTPTPAPDASEGGCGCGATSVGAPWLMLVFSAWMGRRRRDV
ncbi:hypothetical protein [Myxococcus xanthus]|uniref:hypothetical protein n=1 Tax=Myxococcus xanthus TaxID=34 RepID=UPI00148CEA41|nr:hypothetical protein [Myxococcus xanthus]NOJ86216.1 hypothetical protein [Myxococcus xanthus]